jgi:hypothetical protein
VLTVGMRPKLQPKSHVCISAAAHRTGLMVQCSPSCWLKASVEAGGLGQLGQLGVVVTNGGFSDWSTQDFPSHIHTVRWPWSQVDCVGPSDPCGVLWGTGA